MTDFKKKLSALLNESTEHMIFMDEPVYADIGEQEIVSEVSAAGPLYGLKFLGTQKAFYRFLHTKKRQ